MADIEYPITPLEGSPFPRFDDGNLITISEIAESLNSFEQQNALDALGITIGAHVLSINFVERGKAYADPENDRTLSDDFESESSFTLDIEVANDIPARLPLSIELDGWFQENVNFLGRIIIRDIHVLPLTGRGTAALEGKSNDCHAGYCTGGACASFQERAALILAISLAAGASNRDLALLTDEFSAIDARFHGRRPILDYTLHCCLFPYTSAGSYRSFLLSRAHEVDPVMTPLLSNQSNAVPNAPYFSKLRQKLSDAELFAARLQVIDYEEPTLPPPPAVEESLYPITPLEPDLQCPMNVQNLATLISYPPRQSEAIRALGFTLPTSDSAELIFRETGRAYQDPEGDRTMVEEAPSEVRFVVKMGRLVEPGQLCIGVKLGGWEQKGVNFLGKVEVERGGERFVIPLTGRGTAALEGRREDAHAGFCTGPACAGFQIRSAFCLAIARAIGASDSEILAIGQELHTVNERYHGRAPILDYTVYCALTPNAESYLDYMTECFEDDSDFLLLQAMKHTGRPHRGYFEALHKKFSVDELEKERMKRITVTRVTMQMRAPTPEISFAESLEKEKKKKKNLCMPTFTRVAVGVSVIAGIVIIAVFFALRK